MGWRGRLVVSAGVTILAATAGWLGWRALRGGVAARPAGVAAAERPASATFVGETTCAGCHAEEASAWRASQHAVAMQEADESTVKGDFSNATLTHGDVSTTFFRDNARFMVRTEGADGELHDYPVKYTFGVDPLQQYLIALPGGRVQALSIAWDARPKEIGGQRWFSLYPDQDIGPHDPLHWTGRQQNWNFMCADCHSTNVAKGYDARTNTFRTTFSEINVSCEACHGPGSRHIEWAKAPGLLRWLVWRDDGLTAQLTEREGVSWHADPVTGNVQRSTPRSTTTEIQVCAQCHSRRAQILDGYTAGDAFLDYYLPSLVTSGLYHADGQQKEEVYVYGSFLQSRMFHAGVTCSDCHEPHTQQLRAPDNRLCTRCHEAGRYETEAHTFHVAGSDGAMCVSCHMPETTYMQIDPRRDHSIRVPRPAQSVALGVPNACNGCHTDQSAEWAAERVRDWYGHDPRGFQHFAEAFAADESGEASAGPRLVEIADDAERPRLVRASALVRLAARPGAAAIEAARVNLSDSDPQVRHAALSILESAPLRTRVDLAAPLLADSSRAVRIEAAWLLAPASAALSLGGYGAAFEAAADEFIASQRYNADRPESRVTLGTFFARLGRAAEAEDQYRAALRLAPDFVAVYVNLADLYSGQGREAEAESLLRAGLDLSPEAPILHHALGLSLARSGGVSAAVDELERAASLAPDDAGFAYAYAVALNSVGRSADAIEVLQAARARHPDDRDLLFALSTFNRDRGDLDSARRYARLLHRAYPGDADASALFQSLGGEGP